MCCNGCVSRLAVLARGIWRSAWHLPAVPEPYEELHALPEHDGPMARSPPLFLHCLTTAGSAAEWHSRSPAMSGAVLLYSAAINAIDAGLEQCAQADSLHHRLAHQLA